MTHAEWIKKKIYLERSIISLKGHARSGRNDLAKKLAYVKRMKDRAEELRQHKLSIFDLVTE